jgi:hypothetical protein
VRKTTPPAPTIQQTRSPGADAWESGVVTPLDWRTQV